MTSLKNNYRFRRLTEILRIDGLRATVKFDDGCERVFDGAVYGALLPRTELTRPLIDKSLFKSAFIDNGNLAWPNGFDVFSEEVYNHGGRHPKVKGC